MTSFIIHLYKFSKNYVCISFQCHGQNKTKNLSHSSQQPLLQQQFHRNVRWLSWSLIYKNLNAFPCSVVSLLYFQMRTDILTRLNETNINVDKDAKQSWVTVTKDLQKINRCLWCPKCRLQPMFSQLQCTICMFPMTNDATPVFSLCPTAGMVKTVSHNCSPQ